jgi:DNA-binding MarR family transcriptional regulator
MNVRVLIDGIVRQTTVLIAQLATSGGLRAPLSHVAGQVFLELSRELESQGVTKKVSADMFGMALRTYQRRTQRLSQSLTDRGRSLWEAILDYLGREGPVTREEILRRFRNDDEPSVKGVLRDLIESGIAFSSGAGDAAVYRLASADELEKTKPRTDESGLEAFVWSVVFRDGPLTLSALSSRMGISTAQLEPILDQLVQASRVERVEQAGTVRFESREITLGLEDPAGWEAAVLDHFSMLVKTVARKLQSSQRASRLDETGGSTYHLTLFRGHPLEEEALGELRRFRERFTALRARIDQYNAEHGLPDRRIRVDAYFGQCVVEEESEDDADQDF